MKKFLSLFLAFVCIVPLLVLSGCNSQYSNSFTSNDKLKIVTTIFPYYDFVRNITADKAEIKLLLSPGSEPHSYEPSPSDIVAIENCDVFIYNGGESDEWVDGVLDSIENRDMAVLKMMDYVDALNEQTPEHTEGDELDEHIWTSLRNAQSLVSAITEAICTADAENKSLYEKNRDEYISALDALDKKISEAVINAKRNVMVFGDRFPFLYFVNDYKLDYECAFPGCSSETEPSIATVSRLIDYVRVEKIPVVFYLEFSNGKIAQIISEDSDAETMQFSSCHNVTKDEFTHGVTYISLMEQNLNALKEALY